MAYRLRLEIYSHGVKISRFNREVSRHLASFFERLTLSETRRLPRGGFETDIKKRFFGKTHDGREAFIHRHTLVDLDQFLFERGYRNEEIERIHIGDYVPVRCEYILRPEYTLRDYQIPIVDSLCEPAHTRGVKLQTGRGKSLSQLAAIARLGLRALIMVPPKYFGLWTKALSKTFVDFDDKFFTVSGSNELKNVMQMAVNGTLTANVIIISNVTYRTYIESYERFGEAIVDMGYVTAPYRFHELLKIGVQSTDEFQEDPALVFRIDMYTNVPRHHYLSATPFTGNRFVTDMINVMLPPSTDVPLPDLDVYINVAAILYSDNVRPKQYMTPHKNMYNHARYETHLLKDNKRRIRYFNAIEKIARTIFVSTRETGQKLLVLCATVKFIKEITRHLREIFSELVVGYHVSGSDYTKLMTNDITVSTIKSSGTGVDIPNLREVLLLQASDSERDNVQILGRLRHLEDYPGLPPRMTYMVCRDIPQHQRYHVNKINYFKPRVLAHKVFQLG